jgi:hypothetical protein
VDTAENKPHSLLSCFKQQGMAANSPHTKHYTNPSYKMYTIQSNDFLKNIITSFLSFFKHRKEVICTTSVTWEHNTSHIGEFTTDCNRYKIKTNTRTHGLQYMTSGTNKMPEMTANLHRKIGSLTLWTWWRLATRSRTFDIF